MNTSFRKYLIEIGQHPLLTAVEEMELAIAYKEHGDLAARDKLITSNLRLVVNIAKNYKNTHLSIADLVSEGNAGLIAAVEKYDPSLNYRFSTCATPWIKQAITKAITDKGRNIRVPAHIYQALGKMRRTIDSIEADGTVATDERIAAEMGVSVAKVKEYKLWLHDTISMNTPLGHDSEETIGDLVADTHTETPYEFAEKTLLHDKITKMLSEFKERPRQIIELRYGLGPDGKEHTLEEIGDLLGITRERVRQIEKETLAKMKLTWDLA